MKIRDVYSAKAIALVQTEVASNRIPYLCLYTAATANR